MAVIEDIVNLGYCSESNFQGTATNYCIFDIKRLKKLWRFPLNFKFEAGFEFTLANLQELEQQGKLVPIYTLKDAQFTTAENGVQTFGGGDKKLIEKMPFEIEAMLTNGVQGYQAVISIEKATYHSFVLVDAEDTIWVAEDKTGLIGAINSEFMQVLPYTGAGSESASYKINFQLDRLTIDTRLKAIKADSFDFATDDIKGVDDITLTLTAPINGGSTVTFTAKRTKDGHNVEQGGLVVGDFLLTSAGSTIAGTLAYANGVYTFTRSSGTWATGNIITLKTWDSTLSVQIINVDGQMIKSNVATTVAVAS